MSRTARVVCMPLSRMNAEDLWENPFVASVWYDGLRVSGGAGELTLDLDDPEAPNGEGWRQAALRGDDELTVLLKDVRCKQCGYPVGIDGFGDEQYGLCSEECIRENNYLAEDAQLREWAEMGDDYAAELLRLPRD